MMKKMKEVAMAESYRWPQVLNEPRKMSLVIDRSFTVVWADQQALRYFGACRVHRMTFAPVGALGGESHTEEDSP